MQSVTIAAGYHHTLDTGCNIVMPINIPSRPRDTPWITENALMSHGTCPGGCNRLYINPVPPNVSKIIISFQESNEPRHEKTNVLVSDLVRQKPGCTATEDG